MVIGDSQWLGAASRAATSETQQFITIPASTSPCRRRQYYSLYGGKYWSIPLEGDASWAIAGLVRGPDRDGQLQGQVRHDLGVPKDYKELMDIAEFFTRPDENKYGVALYTQTAYDAMAMGVEQTIFTWGGDLGDYTTNKVDGILNSPQNIEALEAYRKLYTFTPPNWTQAFFAENNQAYTEGLVAMNMNYFAFMPALASEASNPYANVTGYFANPPGPNGDQHAALGGQGIRSSATAKTRRKPTNSCSGSSATTSSSAGPIRAIPAAPRCSTARGVPQRTPYNRAFARSMEIVKDFWAVPVFADMLFQMNDRLHPYITTGQGTAQEALDGLAEDWKATLASSM